MIDGDITVQQRIDRIYREDSSRILATLIRLLGDFDRAEEAMQDAFAVAVESWRGDSIPSNPRAWLISTARHRSIDRSRRDARTIALSALAMPPQSPPPPAIAALEDESGVEDDRLRLVFTCCHPALALEAQVALTLRTVCALTTEQIARAFLVPVPTMAQRLVRATSKIRDAGIPYRVPSARELPERLESVLAVVYLVFTEGYAAMTSGDVRHELCGEAIRLARLLAELMPRAGEVTGLLALMLLHDARRATRLSPEGEILLLDEQDRSRWDASQIAEGLALVDASLHAARAESYAIQAAIAALHASAPSAAETDWRQIAALYALLLSRAPSPVIELNHAVAVAMIDGPQAGLLLMDAIAARGELRGYHLLHAARADLLRRLGRADESRAAYETALALAIAEPERRFLERRISDAQSRG